MGTQGVSFSLSATTNVAGSNTVALAAGETRRFTENLAVSGVYLVLSNAISVSVKVRMWVE